MSVPNNVLSALVRLTEALEAYRGSGMIVPADIAQELRQALEVAQAVVRGAHARKS